MPRLLFLTFIFIWVSTVTAAPETTLRYTKPAEKWVEALPVGNGRLGAMVFGGWALERFQLNEATLWSGGPKDWNNAGARAILPKVREAIFAGQYREAEALCKKMQGPYNQSYQPLGQVQIDFGGGDTTPSHYERSLDLDRAVALIRYTLGDVEFTRETFSSFPDQLIVVRLTASRPGSITFTASIDSPLRHGHAGGTDDLIIVQGKAPTHVDPNYLRNTSQPIRYEDEPDAEGMTFDLRVQIVASGGAVRTERRWPSPRRMRSPC